MSLKYSKLPNFVSMKNINENLIIIELSKKKCIFDSPIMIGSEVLFNSKCNLYNYMFNIIPNLFEEKILYLVVVILIRLCIGLKIVHMKNI